MTAVSLPTPIVVTRHQCPHCRRTWAKRSAAAAHIPRCWHNPALRNCKTCEHHLPAVYGTEPCNPGEWCACGNYPEACDINAAPAGATFPISHCPNWQPTEETTA